MVEIITVVGSPEEIFGHVFLAFRTPVGRVLLGEGIQSRLVAIGVFWRQCYA